MACATTTPRVNASIAAADVYTPSLMVRRTRAAFSAMRRRDEALGMAQLQMGREAGKREREDDGDGPPQRLNPKGTGAFGHLEP